VSKGREISALKAVVEPMLIRARREQIMPTRMRELRGIRRVG